MALAKKSCELCGGEASVHCDSDSAFLCWACDARVHSANFLASRHGRHFLCPECGSFDLQNTLFFGPCLSTDAFSPCCSSSSSESRSPPRRRRRQSSGENISKLFRALEELSVVPAKVISLEEGRFCKYLRRCHVAGRRLRREGWAENLQSL